MQINAKVKNGTKFAELTITRNGYIITDLWGNDRRIITDPELRKQIFELKNTSGKAGLMTSSIFQSFRDNYTEEAVTAEVNPALIWGKGKVDAGTEGYVAPAPKTPKVRAPRKVATMNVEIDDTPVRPLADPVETVKKWVKFFSEFHFNPQVRFINSLARCRNVEDLNDYVFGYFSLTNNSYLQELQEKMKSDEYKALAEETYFTTKKVINSRLEIYYGEPGSGKTTKAIKDHPDAKVVICHENLTPDELFRGFDFEETLDENGNVTGSHPIFKECAVKEAMMNGQVVILDEINLLNQDCRRALQAITDAKEKVTINNEVIEIKPGFRIIGTMNLVVDEQVFGLPAPLVDRACLIKEFKMPASRLASLAI